MQDKLFTEEHVKQTLYPFEEFKFRMWAPKDSKYPMLIENSVENSFKFTVTNQGIKFYLQQDFYINEDLDELINKALIQVGIYPHRLNNLLKEPNKDDSKVLNDIRNYVKDNLVVQLGFTYFTMIDSLEVNKRGFVLNGFDFIKVSY